VQVPNVWLRPPDQRREADAAKALLSVPDGDHLTLLNVYNNYIQSMSPPHFDLIYLTARLDAHIKSWTQDNYLLARTLSQADNVRTQLQRIMERNDLDIVSINDEKKLCNDIKQALICGFFMQAAHTEGEKSLYFTAKDNQVWRAVQLCIRHRL
jgi:pre-mRNA-splicing factor ATP-dependent RNA helicase DHX15/PRP43